MTPIERLHETLTGLGLTALVPRVEALLEQAAQKQPSYADFFLHALSAEA